VIDYDWLHLMRRDGRAMGKRPGKLIRGAQGEPRAFGAAAE